MSSEIFTLEERVEDLEKKVKWLEEWLDLGDEEKKSSLTRVIRDELRATNISVEIY